MANNDNYYLNFDKLSKSVKTLESADSCLSNTVLPDTILDLETKLQEISFEHGNCLKEYKGEIEKLLTDIEHVKKEVNKLKISVCQAIAGFNNDEEGNTKFKKLDFSSVKTEINQAGTTNNPTVTQIPPVNTNEGTTETQAQQTQTSHEINTVPIGLGIAAAGIAGSLGAVVLDSVNYKREDHLNSYKEQKTHVREIKKDTDDYDEYISREDKFDDVTPYHASRDKTSLNKFYDDDNE